MNRSEARDLAIRLIREYGLENDGWRFKWMNRSRTLGLCKYRSQEILLSASYVDLNDADHVEQTIRHEIAHALTPGAKHGPEWVGMAYHLGVRDPKPTCSANMRKGRWQALCLACGKMYDRHRKPKYAHLKDFYFCRCREDQSHMNVLRFKDTAPRIVDNIDMTPKTLVSASLSAQQTSSVQTVPASAESSVRAFTAPQLAVAMKVDPKALRAWLRRNPGMEREYKSTGAWLFPENRVRDIVRAWNATH
jgi:predicted SprT family Zn-dependent metalloprotease